MEAKTLGTNRCRALCVLRAGALAALVWAPPLDILSAQMITMDPGTSCDDQRITSCVIAEFDPPPKDVDKTGNDLAKLVSTELSDFAYVGATQNPTRLHFSVRPRRIAAMRKIVAELLNEPITRKLAVSASARLRVQFEPYALLTTATPGTISDFQPLQGYLGPEGMNALSAWASFPYRGDGASIYDVERGWLNHRDLPTVTMGGSVKPEDRHHGAAVLGVIASKDDQSGTVGLAPKAAIHTVPIGACLEKALSTALAQQVGAGDIVLIETQVPQMCGARQDRCTCNETQCGYVPVEYEPRIWTLIKAATDAGVVVIESAGNGSVDLDFLKEFHLTHDSGSILVGATRSHGGQRMCYSNFGSAVDLQGWGEDVVTLGFGELFHDLQENSYYTDRFGGTSSAAAMVAGVAAVIQSAACDLCKGKLKPKALNDLLRRTGTSSQPASQYIGVRPDLAAALKELKGKEPCISTNLVPKSCS